MAKAPLSVAIAKDLPVTDIKSLIAYAKAKGDKTTFAVGSIGSAGHLATELLKRAGGISYTVVPYKGTAPAFQDLLGGRIDGFIDPILGSLQYHKAGQLRVIAVTSATRTPNLPDVPTVAETIPGFEFYSWYGLWGPAKLPDEIRAQLERRSEQGARVADIRDKFAAAGPAAHAGQHRGLRRSSSATTWRRRRRSSPKATYVSSDVLARGALAGLHVVVTGSSAGIGRAIAARLARARRRRARIRSSHRHAGRDARFHPVDGRSHRRRADDRCRARAARAPMRSSTRQA